MEYGEKTENHGKSKKKKKPDFRTWTKVRNTDKREKWEIQTVGPGLWQENWKNVQNEKQTPYNLEYVEKK